MEYKDYFLESRLKNYVIEDEVWYQTFLDNRRGLSKLYANNYDLTKKCNLDCLGCLFFTADDYLNYEEEYSFENWDSFFKKEKERRY